MKPTTIFVLAGLGSSVFATPPLSELEEDVVASCRAGHTPEFSGIVPGSTVVCSSSAPVIVHANTASTIFNKREDEPGDRRHAQYVGQSKIAACPTCLSTGFCGKISTISDLDADKAPPRDECDTIRQWASDHNNQGYWRISMDRLHSIPWIPLITAGSCTVAVGDNNDVGERNGLIIGTKDILELMKTAIWDHDNDGAVGVTGWWEFCSATSYRGDSLTRWDTKFQIMRKGEVP